MNDVYREVPCKCGYTPQEQREQFEIYYMKIGTIMGKELPKKPVLRCKTCKDISIIKRDEVNKTDPNIEGLEELHKIINSKNKILL